MINCMKLEKITWHNHTTLCFNRHLITYGNFKYIKLLCKAGVAQPGTAPTSRVGALTGLPSSNPLVRGGFLGAGAQISGGLC